MRSTNQSSDWGLKMILGIWTGMYAGLCGIYKYALLDNLGTYPFIRKDLK